MFRIILWFVASVILAALLTSLVATQIILSELEGFGLSVSFIERVNVTLTDLSGLGITLVVLIAPGFLIGFLIANYARQFIGGNRKLWYLAAGFSTFPVTLYLIKYFMGVTLLASARTAGGMLLAGACCMFAAWLFASFTSSSILEGNKKASSNERKD